MTKKKVKKAKKPEFGPAGNRDFVAHGSDQHAAILSLRKATEEDTYQLEGWTLMDPTEFGPQATEAYVKEVLRQRVAELKSGKPYIPEDAPPLFRPDQVEGAPGAARGIVV